MTTEQRISRLEEIIQETRDRLGGLEGRLEQMEQRMQVRMDTQFRWLLGVTITLWSTTMLGVIATLVAILVKL